MYIEIFNNRTDEWYWHFRNKGRITADSEAFPTKAHALRAAKAVVTATIAELGTTVEPVFAKPVEDSAHDCFIVRWS
jgi:uncharacterized protein YegP (UPF0339 family)